MFVLAGRRFAGNGAPDAGEMPPVKGEGVTPMSHIPIPPPRIFTVEWDAVRRKFNALNDGRESLGMSADRANAIGTAIRGANNACRSGGCVAVQILLQNGTYRTEYIAQPVFRQP
jgi:hypothetical protein